MLLFSFEAFWRLGGYFATLLAVGVLLALRAPTESVLLTLLWGVLVSTGICFANLIGGDHADTDEWGFIGDTKPSPGWLVAALLWLLLLGLLGSAVWEASG